jgi:hypothetical protein
MLKNSRSLRSLSLLQICSVVAAMKSLCDAVSLMKNGYFADVLSKFSNIDSGRMFRAAPGAA